MGAAVLTVGANRSDVLGVSMSMSSDGMTLATATVLANGDGSTTVIVETFAWDANLGAWIALGTPISVAGDGSASVPIALSGDGPTLAFTAVGGDGAASVQIYSWDEPSSDWSLTSAGAPQASAGVLQSDIGLSLHISSDGSPEVTLAEAPSGATSARPSLLVSDGDAIVEVFADLTSFSSDGNAAVLYTGGAPTGSIQVYARDQAGNWTAYGSPVPGIAADAADQVDVSDSGTTLVVTHYGDGGSDAGYVRIYTRDATTGEWVVAGDDIVGTTSGTAVSVSGDGTTVTVGDASGGVQVYDVVPPGGRSVVLDFDDMSGDFVAEFEAAVLAAIANRTSATIDPNAVASLALATVLTESFLEGSGLTTADVHAIASDIAGEPLSITVGGVTYTSVAVTSGSNTLTPTVSPSVSPTMPPSTSPTLSPSRTPLPSAGAALVSVDNATVESISISADGAIMAVSTVSSDGTASVIVYGRDADTGEWVQIGQDVGSSRSVDGVTVSVSGDGQTFATATVVDNGDGTVSILVEIFAWDETSGTWIAVGSPITETGEYGNDVHLVLSADGGTVAFITGGNCCDLGGVRLAVYNWDEPLQAWERLVPLVDEFPLVAGSNSEVSLTISSDGTSIAVVPLLMAGGSAGDTGGDTIAQLFNVGSSSESGPVLVPVALDPVFHGAQIVSFSEDGTVAAVFVEGEPGYIQMYQLNETGSWVTFGGAIPGNADGLSMSASGTTLAVTHYTPSPGYVRVYTLDGETGEWEWTGADIAGAGPLTMVQVSADGSIVAVSNNGVLQTYRVRELATSTAVSTTAVVSTDSELIVEATSSNLSADGSDGYIWIVVAIIIVAMCLICYALFKRSKRKTKVEIDDAALKDALDQLDNTKAKAAADIQRTMESLSFQQNDPSSLESSVHIETANAAAVAQLTAAVARDTEARLEESRIRKQQEMNETARQAEAAQNKLQAELDALRKFGKGVESDAKDADQMKLLELRLALANQKEENPAFLGQSSETDSLIQEIRSERARILGLLAEIEASSAAVSEEDSLGAVSAEDEAIAAEDEANAAAKVAGLEAALASETAAAAIKVIKQQLVVAQLRLKLGAQRKQRSAKTQQALRVQSRMVQKLAGDLKMDLRVADERLKCALAESEKVEAAKLENADMEALDGGIASAIGKAEAAAELLMQAQDMAAADDMSEAAAVAAEEAAKAIKASLEQELMIEREKEAVLAAQALKDEEQNAGEAELAAAAKVAELESVLGDTEEGLIDSAAAGDGLSESVRAIKKQLQVAQLKLRLSKQRKQRSAKLQQAKRVQSSLVAKLAAANNSKAQAESRLHALETQYEGIQRDIDDAVANDTDSSALHGQLRSVATQLRLAHERVALSKEEAKAQFDQWVSCATSQEADQETKSAETSTDGALDALAKANAMVQDGSMDVEAVEAMAAEARAAVQTAITEEIQLKTQQQLLATINSNQKDEAQANDAQEAASATIDRLAIALNAVTGEDADASRAAVEKQLKVAELKLRMASNRANRAKRCKSARRVQVSLVHRMAAANKARQEASADRIAAEAALNTGDLSTNESAAAETKLLAANERAAASLAQGHQQLTDWAANTTMADIEAEAKAASEVTASAVNTLVNAAVLQEAGSVDAYADAEFNAVAHEVRREVKTALFQETQLKTQQALLSTVKAAEETAQTAEVAKHEAERDVQQLAECLAAQHNDDPSSRDEMEKQLRIAELKLKMASNRANRAKRCKSARRVQVSLVHRMAAANKARQEAETERIAAELRAQAAEQHRGSAPGETAVVYAELLAADERVACTEEQSQNEIDDWTQNTDMVEIAAEAAAAKDVTASAVADLVGAAALQEAGGVDDDGNFQEVAAQIQSELKEAITQETELTTQHKLLISVKKSEADAEKARAEQDQAERNITSISVSLVSDTNGEATHGFSRNEAEGRLEVAKLQWRLAANRAVSSSSSKSELKLRGMWQDAAKEARREAVLQRGVAEETLRSTQARGTTDADADAEKAAAYAQLLAADVRVACATNQTQNELASWAANASVADVEAQVQAAADVTANAVEVLVKAAELQASGRADCGGELLVVESEVRRDVQHAVKQEAQIKAQHDFLVAVKIADVAAHKAAASENRATAEIEELEAMLAGNGSAQLDDATRAEMEKRLKIAKLRLRLAKNQSDRSNRARSAHRLQRERLIIWNKARQEAEAQKKDAENQLAASDGSTAASPAAHLFIANERVANSVGHAESQLEEWSTTTSLPDVQADADAASGVTAGAIDLLIGVATLQKDATTGDAVREALKPTVESAHIAVKDAVDEELNLLADKEMLATFTETIAHEQSVQAEVTAAGADLVQLEANLKAMDSASTPQGKSSVVKRSVSRQIGLATVKLNLVTSKLRHVKKSKGNFMFERTSQERKMKAATTAVEAIDIEKRQAASVIAAKEKEIKGWKANKNWKKDRATWNKVKVEMASLRLLKTQHSALSYKLSTIQSIRKGLLTEARPPLSPLAARKRGARPPTNFGTSKGKTSRTAGGRAPFPDEYVEVRPADNGGGGTTGELTPFPDEYVEVQPTAEEMAAGDVAAAEAEAQQQAEAQQRAAADVVAAKAEAQQRAAAAVSKSNAEEEAAAAAAAAAAAEAAQEAAAVAANAEKAAAAAAAAADAEKAAAAAAATADAEKAAAASAATADAEKAAAAAAAIAKAEADAMMEAKATADREAATAAAAAAAKARAEEDAAILAATRSEAVLDVEVELTPDQLIRSHYSKALADSVAQLQASLAEIATDSSEYADAKSELVEAELGRDVCAALLEIEDEKERLDAEVSAVTTSGPGTAETQTLATEVRHVRRCARVKLSHRIVAQVEATITENGLAGANALACWCLAQDMCSSLLDDRNAQTSDGQNHLGGIRADVAALVIARGQQVAGQNDSGAAAVVKARGSIEQKEISYHGSVCIKKLRAQVDKSAAEAESAEPASVATFVKALGDISGGIERFVKKSDRKTPDFKRAAKKRIKKKKARGRANITVNHGKVDVSQPDRKYERPWASSSSSKRSPPKKTAIPDAKWLAKVPDWQPGGGARAKPSTLRGAAPPAPSGDALKPSRSRAVADSSWKTAMSSVYNKPTPTRRSITSGPSRSRKPTAKAAAPRRPNPPPKSAAAPPFRRPKPPKSNAVAPGPVAADEAVPPWRKKGAAQSGWA